MDDKIREAFHRRYPDTGKVKAWLATCERLGKNHTAAAYRIMAMLIADDLHGR